MTAPLIDVLDWVEELREDLRSKLEHTSDRRDRRYLDVAKCGTSANYRQHLRLKQKACASCRAAESRRQADWRKRNGDKVRANRRRWRAANKAVVNRKKREWRAGHGQA